MGVDRKGSGNNIYRLRLSNIFSPSISSKAIAIMRSGGFLHVPQELPSWPYGFPVHEDLLYSF